MADNISFLYKKYHPIPAGSQQTITRQDGSSPPSVTNVPAWIDYNYAAAAGDTQVYTFYVNPTIADSLAPGFYTQTVKITTYVPGSTFHDEYYYYAITLEVVDSVRLTVTPSNLSYNYTTGGATPATQNISIQSENNWTVTSDQSWVNFSSQTGLNNGVIAVGITTSGLNVGVYSAILTIDDGIQQVFVNVSLIVSGEDTVSDYLNVEPTTIEFAEILDSLPIQSHAITIDSSEAWSATFTKPWLQLTASSGATGETTIQATVDNAGLDVGVFYDTITITTSSIVKIVYVILNIVEQTTVGIESGNLYFAKDRNTISISNTQTNTYAYLDFISSTLATTVNYIKKRPYFQGLAKILVGTETENILAPESVTTSVISRVYHPVTPMDLSVNVYDKHIFTNTSTLRQGFVNLRFLNGTTPEVTNRLTHMPADIVTTANAVVALSFLSENIPGQINITGAITQTILVNPTENDVYTALVNLSDFTLEIGDVITIECEGHSVNVTIQKTPAETTLLGFQNEWDCPELFMLKGRLTITNTKGWSTTAVTNQGDEHTKILKATDPISFKINTGLIYYQEEVEWLAKLFTSKKIFIFINDEKIEVIPTFSNLKQYETRDNIRSFELTFKKAIV